MTSTRLKSVYNSKRWRGPIRKIVLARAGGRCEHSDLNLFGEEVRCAVLDGSYGGSKSLLVDHIDDMHPDPWDPDNLQALCPAHSGMKDGGRRYG